MPVGRELRVGALSLRGIRRWYYTFRLGRAASVTIDLTSPSVDTLLALRNGTGTGTGLIESDDDDGAGTNARITRTLTPGTYTIGGDDVSRGGVTGPFTLTLAVGEAGAGPDLVVESPGVSDATLTGGRVVHVLGYRPQSGATGRLRRPR